MQYKIGLGLILPDKVHDQVRGLELDIAHITDNVQGLTQPPHITIKRPFELASESAFKMVFDKLDTLKKIPIDPLEYESINSFANGTIYLKVSPNRSLDSAHKSILEFCESIGIKHDRFEGENVIFHTTLAMDLSDAQCKSIRSKFKHIPSLISPFQPTKIGVFMWLPDSKTWIIVKILEVVVNR